MIQVLLAAVVVAETSAFVHETALIANGYISSEGGMSVLDNIWGIGGGFQCVSYDLDASCTSGYAYIELS